MANTQETKKENAEVIKDSADQQKIKELESTIESLKAMLTNLTGAIQSQALQSTNKQDNEITLVCTTDAEVDIPFDSWKLRFSKMGQRTKISKEQFNELVNIHRFFLDMEFFMLDSKHIDLANDLRLPVMDNSGKYIKPEDLDRVKIMSSDELRTYYNGLSEATQRNFVGFYLHQCNDRVSGFYDVSKMETMNSLIRGHLFDNLITLCTNDNRQNI